MSAADTHAVLIRPLATGRWEILEYAQSAKSAMLKAREQRTGLSRGDLILAIDIAEISAIQERGQCLYFVNQAGKVAKAPHLPDMPYLSYMSTWFRFWEGPEADAYEMLGTWNCVDRKLRVLTACAMARTVLQYIPSENRSLIAIEMAEAWARGEATLKQANEARNDVASFLSNRLLSLGIHDAIIATYMMTSNQASVAYRVAHAVPGDYKGNLRQLSHIVRQYIPLHIVLESLT